MPRHLQFNPHIRDGYRPLMTPAECLRSIFRLHNETVNILTHGFAIVYILVTVPYLLPWGKHGTLAGFLSWCHLIGAVSPWIGSFLYHVFMNLNYGETVYRCLLKLDMLGIWICQSIDSDKDINLDKENKNANEKEENSGTELGESGKKARIEEFLGTHPDQFNIGEAFMIPDILDRVKKWIVEGIPKDEKSAILKLVPRKCKDLNLSAPKLNDEILASLKEEAIKRDRYFLNYQEMIGVSLSLTASSLSMIMNDHEEEIDRDLLEQSLADAIKLNADLFHSWTVARKVYITPNFKKVKAALDKVQPTEFLFGDNVKDLINKVKAVEGVAKVLKPLQSRKKASNNRSLNWRGSSGKGATRMNHQQNYYNARNQGQRSQRGGFNRQREYSQSQPLQRKN